MMGKQEREGGRRYDGMKEGKGKKGRK